MNLYPSILEPSIERAQQEIVWVAGFDTIRTLQFDIIDGQFIDNLTITPSDLLELDLGEFSCDFHLMTEEPLDYVFELIEHQESIPTRAVIGQVERMSSQAVFLETVKKNNWQTGLSLDFFTPLESIDDDSWSQLDIVQLMAIEAGFQGQEFQERIFEKIKELNHLQKLYNRDWEVIIDGGVKPHHLKLLQAAGVEGVVVGSGLWQAEDLEQAVAEYTQ